MANIMLLEYVGYSTGNYIVDTRNQRRADGITLQFRCVLSGNKYYAIFNASIHRTRTSVHGKAGDPLPVGHFSIGEQSAFMKFWKSTGLPYQRRSNLHQRMGNLAGLRYTATVTDGERLVASTLRPIDLSTEQLPELTNKPQTTHNQVAIKTQTIIANKEMAQPQEIHAFQSKLTAGKEAHGTTVTRERGYTDSSITPRLQALGDWLSDYDSASPVSRN